MYCYNPLWILEQLEPSRLPSLFITHTLNPKTNAESILTRKCTNVVHNNDSIRVKMPDTHRPFIFCWEVWVGWFPSTINKLFYHKSFHFQPEMTLSKLKYCDLHSFFSMHFLGIFLV